MLHARFTLLVLAAALIAPAAASADATLTSAGGVVTLKANDSADSIGGGFNNGQWSFSTTNSSLSSPDGSCDAHHVAFTTDAGSCAGSKLVATLGSDSAAAEGDSFNWSADGVTVQVTGSGGPDSLTSTDASTDTIAGGRGADQIKAGSGDDTVYAGKASKTAAEDPASHDEIDCGAGNDTVYADPDDDLSNCEHKVIKHSDNVEGGVRIGTGKLSHGVFAVKMTCIQSDACKGDTVLRTSGKVKLGKGKAKVQTLGRGKVSLSAGSTLPVNIKLSKAGKKLVKKAGKLPALVTVALDAGLPSSQSFKL